MEHVFKYKQAIAVRGDLEMSEGKLAAQVAHASVGAFRQNINPEIFAGSDLFIRGFNLNEGWFDEGFRKIVLKVPGITDILKAEAKCIEHRVPYFVVYDFGLTELAEDTMTCIGIGPDLNENVDKVTGRMKLWK